MSFDAQTLLQLLPAVYRAADGAQAQTSPGWLAAHDRTELLRLAAQEKSGPALTPAQQSRLAILREHALAGPLASLLAVIAEQVGVLEEDLDQLLDDQFIETCAEMLVPYIGDLIGVRGLHEVGDVGRARAEVAHTLDYRRRKGTVPALEGVARDASGWPVAAAEFFQRLIVTQYSNHVRAHAAATPDLRRWQALHHVGSAFDALARSADVRRVASARGRHNIPNVGLFAWRLRAQRLTGSPAVALDAQRWRFHPLGIDQPIFTAPDSGAPRPAPDNVPVPIARRMLAEHFEAYCPPAGAQRVASFAIYVEDGGEFRRVPREALLPSHLGDSGGSWGNLPPAGRYAVDPELGRIALPPDAPAGARVRVDFRYGACADLGGGEYARELPAAPGTGLVLRRVPSAHATIADALAPPLPPGARALRVEIADSGRYEETLAVDAPAGIAVEICAANGCRPSVLLGAPMSLRGGEDASIRLDGLLIAGHGLHVPGADNALARLELAHCTLVPGGTLAADLEPQFPDRVALEVRRAALKVSAQRCVLGAIRAAADADVELDDCIVDATDPERVAFAGLADSHEGAALRVAQSTFVGRVHARQLQASNSIFLTVAARSGVWVAPVRARRRQQGCVRFCWIPPASRTPRRFECLPESADDAAQATPRFTSLRYGHPAYAQLAASSGERLLHGADDESEPGAYHHLHAARRETNVRVRLDEYLRAGLEAGIFYEN